VQQSRSRRARRNPSPRMPKVTVHEKREVNEKQQNTINSPSHNHDSAVPRQHPLICTGAGLIHPVYGQPMSLATNAISRNEPEVTFSPFSRAFLNGVCGLGWMCFGEIVAYYVECMNVVKKWMGVIVSSGDTGGGERQHLPVSTRGGGRPRGVKTFEFCRLFFSL